MKRPTPEQRARQKITNAAWHAANRERANARRAAWTAATPDREVARQAKWRAENVEKKKLSGKAWRTSHPEFKPKPETKRAVYNNRRARIKNAEGRFTTSDVTRIRRAQRDKCAMCRANLRGRWHTDHITPLFLGGTNWPSNIQLLCRSCNLRKSWKDPIIFSRELGLLI